MCIAYLAHLFSSFSKTLSEFCFLKKHKKKEKYQKLKPSKDQKQKQIQVDTNQDLNMDGIEDMGDEWDVPTREQHELLVHKVANVEIQLQSFFTALNVIKDQITVLTEFVQQGKQVIAQPHVPPDPNMPSASRDSGTMYRQTTVPARETQSKPRETHVLKDTKPPQFSGEERDRNKDAIYTFLQKWQDLHRMKNTPPEYQPLEASLSLGPKAYKWWMSLKEARRIPGDWAQFETIFVKEFLPENEQERNWEDWDKALQRGRPLLTYIAEYREIILKLQGINDFHKVRGFVRGLDKHFKREVKRNAPKTLEDAIKFAQIYEDNTRLTAFNPTQTEPKPTDTGVSRPFLKGKRKFPFNKEGKPLFKKRVTPGPKLNQEDFSKAKKENLCFICLSPDHSQWNCPKNRRRDDEKGKGPDKNHKDRQIHVVQTLPISGNEK